MFDWKRLQVPVAQVMGAAAGDVVRQHGIPVSPFGTARKSVGGDLPEKVIACRRGLRLHRVFSGSRLPMFFRRKGFFSLHIFVVFASAAESIAGKSRTVMA